MNTNDNNEFENVDYTDYTIYRKNLAMKTRIIQISDEVKDSLCEPLLTLEELIILHNLNVKSSSNVLEKKLLQEQLEKLLKLYRLILQFRKEINVIHNDLEYCSFPCDKTIIF